MTTTMRLRSAIASIYGVAILISIFTGGLIWVIIIGAVLAGLAYRLVGGGAPAGAGRDRQRNRRRNRT